MVSRFQRPLVVAVQNLTSSRQAQAMKRKERLVPACHLMDFRNVTLVQVSWIRAHVSSFQPFWLSFARCKSFSACISIVTTKRRDQSDMRDAIWLSAMAMYEVIQA